MRFPRVLLALLLHTSSGVALADDGVGPNRAPDAEGAAPSAVADVAMAGRLQAWGRANGSPEALAAAAVILGAAAPAEAGRTPTQAMAAGAEGAEAAGDASGTFAMDAAALLAQARAMADETGAKALSKHLDRLNPTTRGALGGPRYSVRAIGGLVIDSYVIAFEGRRPAEVAITGAGTSDLDLHIYDQNGNRIGGDTSLSDDGYVGWIPLWTGNFEVRVVNTGTRANQYLLVTN